jgi:hypothetical protein
MIRYRNGGDISFPLSRNITCDVLSLFGNV